jgi:hypothetical protein
MADCGGHGVLNYVRFSPSGDPTGKLRGSVRIEQKPFAENSPPLSGSEVTLSSNRGDAIHTTQTDSNGQFEFKDLTPGYFSLQFAHAGFYPLTELWYKIGGGLESNYWPVYMERCLRGNCDPKLRPKKQILCE